MNEEREAAGVLMKQLAASQERVRVLEEALREIDDAIPPKPVLPLSCQIREIVRAALAKETK